ncbi:MAG: hypothetical protein JWM59_1594 [Verrucomicrobiales bacterium]|nr:hypothetical protein [Verrucomicrobiales bacterium]
MAWRFTRFVPILLPPLAAVVCFVWSAQRRSGLAGQGGAGGSGRREAVPEQASALAAGDLETLGKLRLFEARVAAAPDVLTLTEVWRELQDGVPVDWIKNRLGSRIYNRMLDLDPVAGWNWAQSFPGDNPPALMDFVRVWGARDPAAAAAAVMAWPGNHQLALDQVAQGWAGVDPVGFLNAGTLDGWKMIGGQPMAFERAALVPLAERDLPLALALAPKHCPDYNHFAKDVYGMLADRMMEERGVEGALAWARELTDYPAPLYRRLIAEILPVLARTDPRRAARELTDVISDETKEAASLIAGQWAPKEPVEALKWATSLPEDGPTNGFSSNANSQAALTKIGEVIGPDAARLLRVAGEMSLDPAFPPSFALHKLAPLILGAGGGNPAKFTADLAAGPSGRWQEALVAASMMHWSIRDAPAAFAYLWILPEKFASLAREVMPGNFIGIYLSKLTAEQAAEFIQILREDPARADVKSPYMQSEVWKHMAIKDPGAALALLAEYSERSADGGGGKGVDDHSWSAVYRAWADRDPQAAAERALTVSGEKRAAAISGVVAGWAEFDPMAASAWAGTLPDGPLRQSTAGLLAKALIWVEPSSAFAWAISMGEGDDRSGMLESALQALAREDFEAVRKALENPSLSAGSRDHFSKILDRLPK